MTVDNCIPSRKFKKMLDFPLLINNGKLSDALKKPMLLFTSSQIMEISRRTPSFISLSTRVNHQINLKRLEYLLITVWNPEKFKKMQAF
jgi:hypothetical protein